jgi:hypothetical protein
MYTSLSNRLLAMAVVCSLLLQSCGSGLRATTEEPALKQDHPTTAGHVQASGGALAPGVLALVGSRADAGVSSVSSSELVSAAVPASPQFFAGPFTASSGECVLLRQQQGQWQAVIQGSAGACAHKRTLSVVSSGNIGASLKALQGQDAWSSRSRIHVLSIPPTPLASSMPCVYVGKLGLLGGTPTKQAKQQRGHEERQAAEEYIKLAEERTKLAEEHVRLAEERTKSSEERAKLAEERTKLAEERVSLAEERTKSAEERAKLAEERARLAEEKLVNLEKQALLLQTATPTMPFEASAKSEERERLQATQAQQWRGYEEKQVAEERARLAEERVKLAEERLANLEKQALIPAMAFGGREWEKYFGAVGTEPSLPSDIVDNLNSTCPFWPGKQVKDTHLLVLIPSKVGGKPFSLDLLGELIQHPRGGGHATQYSYYGDAIEKQFGTQSPRGSYWVLMTRDVLEGSRSKRYAFQKALVAAHTKRTGLPYALPGVLEAATAILSHYVRSGECLYTDDPRTWTRCQELVDGEYPAVVGGFSSGGLCVCYDVDNTSCYYGVAGLRKF